ncbi:hypothetical protein HS088_TW07G00597 [Tripterygium wilfordii]|uniref:Phospholipase A2 family protein n=1 Tax=Tripterygium wilfordii TaxID=458696 RepID=A0A7J7DG40_TRIWF|nr:uncharacterized protein LOC120001541 [Tripterygium wilfordii]KAF5745016.1 hypothetical protein HS088_TW07G00597 [Tripterygium wilfordii]
MNFGFVNNLSLFHKHSKRDLQTIPESKIIILEQSKPNTAFNIKIWVWSLLSVVPWAMNTGEKIQGPSTINRRLKKHARPRRVIESNAGITRLPFRPYVPKVPWHTGPRAFLSQLFPRYGHYCGPNWSSGKDGGSLLWDKRPVDWLDFCCYCHDVGYDTHDQAKLLEADFAFLECLERQHGSVKGDPHIAQLYKTMCITGLNNFLIPYRSTLVRLQAGQPLPNFSWLSYVKWKYWKLQKA